MSKDYTGLLTSEAFHSKYKDVLTVSLMFKGFDYVTAATTMTSVITYDFSKGEYTAEDK